MGRSMGLLVIRGTLLSLDFGLAEVNGEWYNQLGAVKIS